MQNVTHIAPAIAAFFFTHDDRRILPGHAPLAYLIGFIIVLALGMCLVQLAKKFPSAGGYYTYVSRTIGPRSGFLTGLDVRALLTDRRRPGAGVPRPDLRG